MKKYKTNFKELIDIFKICQFLKSAVRRGISGKLKNELEFEKEDNIYERHLEFQTKPMKFNKGL